MTDDYYDLLGVAPDASRDEIRAAYRERIEGLPQAEKAHLNRAWNVLSDPVQRDRYDERLAAAALDDEAGEVGGDGDGDLPPLADEDRQARPRGATGARRAAPSPKGRPAPAAGARSDAKAGGKRPPPPPRPRPEPNLVLPAGVSFAPSRTRNLALAFDVAVLLLVVLLSQQFFPRLINSDYQHYTDQYNAQVKKADAASKREDKANDRADQAEKAARKAERQNDAVEQQAQEQKATAAKKDANTAKQQHDAAQDQAKKIKSDHLDPVTWVATGIAFLLALLYVVPLSAITGQTLGKRLRKVKVIKVDGSPIGWFGSLVHYGLPIAVAILLSPFLGPLAALAGLGIVLWYLRDRNFQGAHDKLAKTVVVDVSAAPR